MDTFKRYFKTPSATRKTPLMILVMVLLSVSSYSQIVNSFGIKAGINYNANGDLKTIYNADDDFNFSGLGYSESPRGRVGYHFGLWAKKEFNSLPLYIQPEILYTQTKSTYIDFDRSDYVLNKLEIPLLVGVEFLKIGRVFAGPDFQFIMNSDFKNSHNSKSENIQTDNFLLAAHIGIGLELGKFGLDIRYEKGISKAQTTFTNDFITIDAKANQLICSLKYQIGK